MQFVMTAMAVIAGMVFSVAISLLVEELLFGKVFRLFFAQPAAVPAKSGQKH
jgi:ABC-type sugar transport system permease subunit